MSEMAIALREVLFGYPGRSTFELNIRELMIESNDSVAIIGPSGSGKTTLLGLLAGTLVADQGKVELNGTDLCRLDDRGRRQFRIRNIGQVLQSFELLHYLSVIENVMLPHYILPSEQAVKSVRAHAQELLVDVGLGDREQARPDELSQGEQQRVAVCRALINRPGVLLADEPTGNLDQANKQHVVNLLLEQAQTRGSVLVMATHDQSLLDSFSRVIDVRNLSGHDGKPVAA